jgi:hypothetical protein
MAKIQKMAPNVFFWNCGTFFPKSNLHHWSQIESTLDHWSALYQWLRIQDYWFPLWTKTSHRSHQRSIIDHWPFFSANQKLPKNIINAQSSTIGHLPWKTNTVKKSHRTLSINDRPSLRWRDNYADMTQHVDDDLAWHVILRNQPC